jgi:hypothetical protein
LDQTAPAELRCLLLLLHPLLRLLPLPWQCHALLPLLLQVACCCLQESPW